MKNVNKGIKRLITPLTFVILVLFAVSCDNQNAVTPQTNNPIQLAQTVLGSTQFKNLGLAASNFSLVDSHYSDKDNNFLSIPLKGTANQSGLMILLNSDRSIKRILYFEINTNQAGDLYSNLKTGVFNGSFLFKFEEGVVQLEVKNSAVSQTKIKRTYLAARCAYWASEGGGGAFDCAGKRIQNMNWLDKTICYTTFAECLAQTVISCAIDGCTIQ
jgi:hypothetical protein